MINPNVTSQLAQAVSLRLDAASGLKCDGEACSAPPSLMQLVNFADKIQVIRSPQTTTQDHALA
jgi:hypothetical protein